MNLDLVNNLFNNLKENKIVQNFMEELSNYLENNVANNSNLSANDYKWNNLISDDLTLYDKKIITKFKNKMISQRNDILQNYAENTKEAGDMYYIYNTSENEKNSYNLCICKSEKSHEVVTKSIEELPEGAGLGSVLRKQGENFTLDSNATKSVGKEINNMIKGNIQEQNKYLDSIRIEGHVYEVGEKCSGRIWLYDLNNTIGGGMEAIEEIEFPKDLYETAKEGDLFVYKNGEYKRHMIKDMRR